MIPDAFEGSLRKNSSMRRSDNWRSHGAEKRCPKRNPDKRKQIPCGDLLCRKRNSHPLFYRKLKCGICGLAPVRKRTARPYYQCDTKAWNSAEGCEFVLIFEDELKMAVLASIRFQAQLARKLQKAHGIL